MKPGWIILPGRIIPYRPDRSRRSTCAGSTPTICPRCRVRLIAGRNITAADRANPYVALISERTAREGFPGENPIGRKISDIVPDDKHPITVIGVVADARINGLKDNAAMVYLPYWAFTPWTLSFLVRSSQPSDALIPEMRRAIWQIDPQVAIPTLKSMDEQVSDSVAADRFQAMRAERLRRGRIVAGVAGRVWRAGLFGLAAPAGVRHPHRIGFGQERADRTGAAAGCISGSSGHWRGLTMALIALRWVRSLLYQTPVMDPLAVGGSVLLLLVAAAIAAIVPARRAASTDPMRALRME